MLCIAEEAARQWVADCSEQERGLVPRCELESWLRLVQEVAVLRLPLLFSRTHADITLSEGGAVATRGGGGNWYRAAASKVAIRSGCHFAHVTAVEGVGLSFGVIRPGYDVEGGANAQHVDGHCFYWKGEGWRYPGDHDWEGRQEAWEPGNRIGMLLDVDQGSMTVWKNTVKLGVMQAEGLSGLYCWAVELIPADSERVESAPAPASPTEEELAAAKAWEPSSESDDE